MPPKKEISNVLTQSHFRSYVSQSGLAAVLQSIREHGLPETTSRAGIKRARERVLPPELFSAVSLETESKMISVQMIHPVRLLQYMVQEIQPFADFMARKLVEHPCSEQTPWNIAVYSDEIIPGNALKPRNDRKLVAFYWSFGEFDAAVGVEDLWQHISALRSTLVRSLKSGWSQLFKACCAAFFQEPFDLSKGVALNLKGHGARMFFAKIGILVGDEPSLKGCWSCKGASGSLPCILCRNVTLASLEVAQNDSTGFFIPHTTTDSTRFLLQDDNGILQNAHALQNKFGQGTKASFARAEMALGLQYAPEGALWSPELVANQLHGGPISVTMFDYMHVYLVSGIWNTEVGLLLQCIKDIVSVDVADTFLRQFVWPSHWDSRSVTGKKSLHKFVADGSELKCSASEGLSLYPVFRLLIMEPCFKYAFTCFYFFVFNSSSICRAMILFFTHLGSA